MSEPVQTWNTTAGKTCITQTNFESAHKHTNTQIYKYTNIQSFQNVN